MAHHYEWIEIRDFTGGLWTVGDWLVPPNGATEMTDCYPLPQGGLRAFAKLTQKTTSGIGANQRPIGFFVRAGIPRRDGAPVQGSDFYMLTYDDSTPRLYRLDETAVPLPTSWSLIRTFASAAGSAMGFFTAFRLSSGTTHVYLAYENTGTDSGLWRIQYSDGAMTKLNAFIGPLVVHQSRLVAVSGDPRVRINWSDPGSETFQGTSFLDVEPERVLPDIVMLAPFAPSDLLLGRRGSPWVMVQGSLTDPVVRALGESSVPILLQVPAWTPVGVAYQQWRDGIYATTDGWNHVRLSSALAPGTLWGTIRDVSLGSMAYINNWLFHGSGLVFDTRTRAWFQISQFSPTRPAKHVLVNRHPDQWRVYFPQDPQSGQAPELWFFQADETSMPRVSTYAWRSAPLRHPSGRQLVIREVQVVLKAYAAGASVGITIGGTTKTVSGIGAGRQKITTLWNAVGEVLDVRVVPNSNNTSIEAPSIEVIRIGTEPGHLTDH